LAIAGAFFVTVFTNCQTSLEYLKTICKLLLNISI
jgi:hypothetical protein